MFEKEIKFISDFCINKISNAGAFLTFEKLNGLKIHPAILKYISAEIDFQIYKERQILLQNSVFDYSGFEISKYFKMISHEIKKSKLFTENEISDLISKAVVFNLNYTTNPNETLTNFIFENTSSRTHEDIIMLLDYPYYYEYLKQILLSYIDRKQLLSVNRKDFEFLLTKIDLELFPSKANEMIDNALAAISEFFNIGAVIRSQISPQAMELYLKEKNLNGNLSRLQSVLSHSPKVKYEIDEIKKIIYSVAEKPEQKTHSLEKSLNETEDIKYEVRENVSVSDNLNPEISSVVEDDLITKQPTESETENIELDDLKAVNPDAKKTLDLTEEINIDDSVETFSLDSNEFEETFATNSIDDSLAGEKRANDILSFLTNKEIEKIISSIFNEDKEDFATTIEIISECKSYEKATAILKSLYTTYNVNPYSRDAILLTNAVAKYFTVA